MADRVVVHEPTAQGGVVEQDAAPMIVYQKPQTKTVATLTGPCTFVDVLGQGETADSPFGSLALLEPHQGPATAVLRPEQLRFINDSSGDVVLEHHQFAAGTHRLHCLGQSGAIHIQHPGAEGTPDMGSKGRVEVTGSVWTLPSDHAE